jgi:hypothetical protein
MKMYNKQEYLLLIRLKKDNLIQAFKDNHVVIAGGAVRAVFANESISDFDVYFKSPADQEAFVSFMNGAKFEKTYRTDVAITYAREDGLKIQAIIMPNLIGLPANEVIDRFDYSVCMGAYDFDTSSFVLGDTFLEHIAARELVYNVNGKYPIASLFRLRKYIRKGYTISGTESIKLALSINALHIQDYKQLKEQLEGIDTLFLKEMTDKLISPSYGEKQYDFKEFMNLVQEIYNDKLEDLLEE